MSSRIALAESANPLNEGLHPSLLEYTHQGRSQSFTSIRGDLRNGGFGTSTLLHIASCHLSELKVSCDIGGHEDVCQFSARHEELRNEVDVPVVDPSILLPWLLPFVIVSVLLEELGEVSSNFQYQSRTRTASMLTEAASLVVVSQDHPTPILLSIPSVVVVPVNVQDLFAFDTQNPGTTVSLQNPAARLPRRAYPESTHSVRPVRG